MLAVSFAMTADAYADRSKTETRRFWKPSHAAKFYPGREFMGWTKDPRYGGVRIHPSRVVSCKLELLLELSEDSFIREGGTRYWPDRTAYIAAMGDPTDLVYVLRFEHLNLSNGARDEPPPVGGGNCVSNFPCQLAEAERSRPKAGVGSIAWLGGARSAEPTRDSSRAPLGGPRKRSA